MNVDGNATFEGKLEAVHVPGYSNSYEQPTGPFPAPRRSWWQKLKTRRHSWNLQRKIDKGTVKRGRT